MSDLYSEIRNSVTRVLEHPSFKHWLADEKLEVGDYILINNSFVIRDVKTVKSKYYLCLTVDSNYNITLEPKIATGIPINLDFKRLSTRSNNLPNLIDINKAVSSELGKLGQIVFLLIGQIRNIVLTEYINHSSFKNLIWDPASNELITISQGDIILREVQDEEIIWKFIEEYFRSDNQNVPLGLREAIEVAIAKLQNQAIAEVEIPSFRTQPMDGIIDAIVRVLNDTREYYKKCLDQFFHNKDMSAFNEILRISYNFASDAMSFIRLIVSICDLKPIVLWGTIAEHYTLSEAFRNLPWTRSRTKPSISNYVQTIADARNSTFHNLFPFRKTLRIPLPDTALQGAELRIFSEYARKNENQLTYQDKELVDVLMEFTRAREQRPSERFWQQNLLVMDATIALFARTSEFLKVLHAEVSAKSPKSD
jgi:hypothetical protein